MTVRISRRYSTRALNSDSSVAEWEQIVVARDQQRDALRHQSAIPCRAFLLLQQHQLAGRRAARRAPRFVQQHQRKESDDLGRRHQLDQESSETDRLSGQIVTRERRPR